ncbi:MAG: tetratricopeptide repeat protein [Dysgonamonadaceae bacterium]|jgi:tetratricopeptide (TPR) repeat protein|nr:tetratricopeptide repeat protein [Dysgonamonadaceae bacterium]
MRKAILIFIYIYTAISVQLVFAQRSIHFLSSDRLFHEGKAMFDDRNYAGCIDRILLYKQQQPDNQELMAEADYLLLASEYHQGYKGVTDNLKEFLETYPTNIHRHEIAFMIGSSHFAEEEYAKAIFWLEESNIDALPETQQEDYAYRMAFSCMKTGKKNEAIRLFSLLKDNSNNYRNTAIYYLAWINFSENEYTQALGLFNQLKDKMEFRPEVLYYICRINFIQGRYSQTVSDGNILLNNYPDNSHNAEINRIIGISHYHEENYTQAIKYLDRFFSSGEEISSEEYSVMGMSHYMQKDYSKAVKYLNLSKPGNNERGQSAYLYIGQSYLNLKDYNNALRAFESASRMDFDSSAKEAATYNYAMLLYQNSVSAFGESVTVLENFLNVYPNSIYSDKVNDALVDIYLTTKNYETALASIAKIKKPGKRILEARQKIYYYLGTIAFTNRNNAEAIRYFSQAIEAGNYAPVEKNLAIYWKGESYYKNGEYTLAINDYNIFLQSGNNAGNLRTLASYNIAYCYFKQQQYIRAESYFQTYISNESNKTATLSDAYARLGDCYLYNRQFADAEKAYGQSAAVMPSAGDYALFQKGFVMGLLKNYKGKIAQMDRLISDFPDSPYIMDAIYEKGQAYVMSENNSAAIETYQMLLNKYPQSNPARKAGIQLGLLYYNINQPEKAAAAYKNVIAKYPGSEEAKVALQDLKSVYFDMNDIAGYVDYVKSLGGVTPFNAAEQDSLTYFAAEKFFNKGDINQAQIALKGYLQAFPNGTFSLNAHYYIANTYYQQKNYAEAKKEYAKTLEFGDTRFTEEAVARTAELQYRDKEYENALISYQRLQNIAESKNNKEVGALGMIRSAAQLRKSSAIINAANILLKDKTISPEIATEARYFRAKAYLDTKENRLAEKDLENLAKDTRTAFGAEAKYLLAQHYFDTGHPMETKIIVQDYIKQGTPHQYWLARSYILLSDVCAAEKDALQARQYLESLQNNYKNTNDDIHQLIKERLK